MPSSEPGYDSFYREFDSPLQRRIREEAYGEDIGQHSWVVGAELRRDIARLGLSRDSRLLDLGCGPCGPLTFVVQSVGCCGVGTDRSHPALAAGRARIATLGLEGRIHVYQADLNEALPCGSSSFDAVIALDVVLHLRDRSRLFREVARVLAPGGRFLFTDAGVVTGSFSTEEALDRSLHGYTQFAAPGFNERSLASAGFRLLETGDRTPSVLKNATGRLTAMMAHRGELEKLTGPGDLERTRRYLETVIELTRRGALSRILYLAESRSA